MDELENESPSSITDHFWPMQGSDVIVEDDPVGECYWYGPRDMKEKIQALEQALITEKASAEFARKTYREYGALADNFEKERNMLRDQVYALKNTLDELHKGIDLLNEVADKE